MKDAGVMVPTTCPFNSSIWSVQKTGGSCRIIGDYQKLNQVVTLIAAFIPEQEIAKTLDTGNICVPEDGK